MEDERLDGRDLEATKVAHAALMSAYALVWDYLSLMPSGRELMERLELRAYVFVDRPFLPLVRYLVESHVRRQLRELHAVYTRLRHARTPQTFSTGAGQAWLREAAADAAGLADTLPPRRWLWEVLLSAVALLPGSVLAWLFKAHGKVDAEFLVLLGVGAVMGLALGAALGTIDASFEAKRMLFGAPVVRQRRTRFDSIYEREDRLFRLLGRAKRKEFPVDTMVSIAMLLISAGFGLGFAANGFRMDNRVGGVGWVVISALLLGGAAILGHRARRRLPPY